MSKVNAMQAIREARYAARASTRVAVPARVPPKAESAAIESVAVEGLMDPEAPVAPSLLDQPVLEPPELVPAVPEPEMPEPEALCGHRSMNNRTCRRPAGHTEKNHRYN